jgi:hypothetical protein
MKVTISGKVLAAILTIAIAAGSAGCTLTVGAASPQGSASDVIHCDRAVCSVDLSKAQTRELYTNLNLASGGVASTAAFCGVLISLPPPSDIIAPILCAVGVTFVGSLFLNAVSRAEEDNGCLRIEFMPPVFYDDHSSYCH